MTSSARSGDGTPSLGAVLETADLDVRLPFEIRFRERDILGPSAGLAYALAVTDLLLGDDLAAGRTVAATGTIDVDGHVGVVGGMTQKSAAVAATRVGVFLVPSDEIFDAWRRVPGAAGVKTLGDALSRLRLNVTN